MVMDPRNAVRRDETAAHYLTFTADGVTITYDATQPGGSAAVGKAVGVIAGNLIDLVADGDSVLGYLESVENDLQCTVQVKGAMRLPGGTGATLTPGTSIVGALLGAARGYIRSAASATAAELIKARGEILDPSDPTSVAVLF